ncbi:choice-of-anchor C family PEP-CTERM protein [Sandarakinorhabdus sp.]|uniref:choice-of-anchor C family PEP-CTERM protein n=1 Tax=Sandarakinorhabdus sp. TaxID=1916663 RepID=UPI00286DC955|nr:choice-of-anchor C family protein [Sandarakinorhabdus sp.]
MIKLMKFVAIAATVMVSGSAAAVTLVNGSFELGTDPGASFSTQNAGSTAITGWTVGGFGVDYIGGYWQASDGDRSVDLSALSAGSIAQMLDTVIGQTYTIGFDLSGNPDGGAGNRISVVTISGSLPDVKVYQVLPANSRADMNWQRFEYTFTAFSALSSLTFASAEFTPFGPAIDNVSITEGGGGIGSDVPEPASWAMMLAGFGMIGATSRRRRPRVVTA